LADTRDHPQKAKQELGHVSKTKNIDSAFRHIRAFTFLIVAASFAFCCFALLKSYELSERSAARVYILSNGRVLQADLSARSENIPVEARDHVESFHRYFSAWIPMKKSLRPMLSGPCTWLTAQPRNNMTTCGSPGFMPALFRATSVSRSQSTAFR
jgi:hypothetical protein